MVHKTGLGKGLDALIPSGEPTNRMVEVINLPIDQVTINPLQPREHFDSTALAELAASIRDHGILQPLVVRQDPISGSYILVMGERRWRAAKQANLETVPVIVREVTTEQQLEWALIENLQREDLNPVETAEAFRHLADDFHLSHQEIADRLGKSRVSVTNALRLLKLPNVVKAALIEGSITEGHARAISGLLTSQAQQAAYQAVVKKELTVRQTEELVRKMNGERPAYHPHRSKEQSAEVQALEDRLRSSLGTRVNLTHGPRGGSVVIHYYSDEELDAIVARILHD